MTIGIVLEVEIMNKLDVIKFLLNEIEEEQPKLIEYNKIVKEAYAQDEISSWRYIDNKWGDKSKPCKSKIQDNLKMIRRLSLEISKEVDD
jgi:hypothetical protein